MPKKKAKKGPEADVIPGHEMAVWAPPPLRLGRLIPCVCGRMETPGHVNQCNPAKMDLRLNWVLQGRLKVLLDALVQSGVIPKAAAQKVVMVYPEPLDPGLLALYLEEIDVSLKAADGESLLGPHIAEQEKRLWKGRVTHHEAWTRAGVVPGVETPDHLDWTAPLAEEGYSKPRVGAGVGWVPLAVYAVEAMRLACEAEPKRTFDLFARMVPRTKSIQRAGDAVSRQTLDDAHEPVAEYREPFWQDADKFWRPSKELVKYYLRKDEDDAGSTDAKVSARPKAIPEDPVTDPVRTAYLDRLRAEINQEDILARDASPSAASPAASSDSDDDVGLIPTTPAAEVKPEAEASAGKGGKKRGRSSSNSSQD